MNKLNEKRRMPIQGKGVARVNSGGVTNGVEAQFWGALASTIGKYAPTALDMASKLLK